MLALSAARLMHGGSGARDISEVLWVVGLRDGVVSGCDGIGIGIGIVVTIVVALKS